MAVIIPPGFAHVVVELALDGDSEPMVNTFGIELSETATPVETADNIMTAFATRFDSVVANGYSVTACDLYVGQDGGSNLVFSSTAAPIVFAGTGNSLPQNCAALVRKRTDLAGRRGRGRFYVPGVEETSVSAVGVLSNTYLTAWQAAADAFLDDLETDGTPMVVLHRSEGIGVEPVPTPIVALVVDERIATQRQRLRP